MTGPPAAAQEPDQEPDKADGVQTFRTLQAAARSTATKTATQEYLTLHLLESFLDRLGRTSHGDGFVLKGGILLTAYNARRPTKDVDANAINADVTVDQLIRVVHDVAGVDAPDGVVFDVTTIDVQEIREHAEYPAYRVRVPATIGPWRGTATWDVTTGDPIVPAPRLVRLERLLGPPLQLLGYAAETAVAEKGVTILERGITSTRWRDYVDIVQLAANGLDKDELRRAAQAVARHRGVGLKTITPHLRGYGRVGQVKWAAWRRKHQLEATSEELLDAQIELVAKVLDPVFQNDPKA